jgi:hydroxymethylglutaryl-CoA lyase
MPLFEALPDRVSVYEVSPRDGLQNEAATVPVTAKVRLIEALVAAGIQRLEVTSFVSPRWVPQLADADQLCRILGRQPGVTYSALCPNRQGLERALAAGLPEVAVFSRLARRTTRRTSTRPSPRPSRPSRRLSARRRAGAGAGLPLDALGLPLRGRRRPRAGVAIAASFSRWAATRCRSGHHRRGHAAADASASCRVPRRVLRARRSRCTCTTRAARRSPTCWWASRWASRTFDASVGGLGGCPYAPGAAGNLATEDLVYMLHGMGIQTGVDPRQALGGRARRGGHCGPRAARQGAQAPAFARCGADTAQGP